MAKMTPGERAVKLQQIALKEEQLRRRVYNQLEQYFPPQGRYARRKYPKHMEFFAAGRDHIERLMMAANRVGKSVVGSYETATHLTGRYQPWWQGRLFEKPTRAWVAGDTKETTRDILQRKLLGPYDDMGTGMIPRNAIVFDSIIHKTGISQAVDSVKVRHESGGLSTLGFKSFDQGRKAFQGTEQDVIWLDEECPQDVYGECVMRIMTTGGLIMLTFTPLSGLTPLILDWLPGGTLPDQRQVDWRRQMQLRERTKKASYLQRKSKQGDKPTPAKQNAKKARKPKTVEESND